MVYKKFINVRPEALRPNLSVSLPSVYRTIILRLDIESNEYFCGLRGIFMNYYNLENVR